MQPRALKLRIYDEEEHPFQDDPRVVPFQMPPRKLRVKEPLFEVPDGFQPMNRSAYRKRFGHLLPQSALQTLQSTQEATAVAE